MWHVAKNLSGGLYGATEVIWCYLGYLVPKKNMVGYLVAHDQRLIWCVIWWDMNIGITKPAANP